jgi:hypothetical protein
MSADTQLFFFSYWVILYSGFGHGFVLSEVVLVYIGVTLVCVFCIHQAVGDYVLSCNIGTASAHGVAKSQKLMLCICYRP